MNPLEQRRKAETFCALHHAPPILILINAWDVCSARLFELEGCKAIATTSAGVAATLGYPDGQYMSLQETAEVTRRIANGIDLPVSADLEAGYADDTEGVVDAVRTIMRAGAVGINIEDSTSCNSSGTLIDVEVMAERLRAIRAMAEEEDIPLVINARTDVYLSSHENTPGLFRETVRRAAAYREAGADCIFVPDTGNLDERTIADLVREIDAPLNIIAGSHLPPIGRLEELGVARVSVGPRHMRVALAVLRTIARELLREGTYEALSAEALTYAEMNDLFAFKSQIEYGADQSPVNVD